MTVIVRTLCFVAFLVLSLLWFRQELAALLDLSLHDDRYTHIILIPLVSLGLIYFKRRDIFHEASYSLRMALSLAVLGVSSLFLSVDSGLPIMAAVIVLTWIAGFVFFYGTRCARAALFPLALLLLAIPIPAPVVAVVEVALQRGSAEVTHWIFRLFAIPVFREGLVFSLPELTIEVARECSGIRSSIALLVTALVLGYLYLRSNWRRACLIILVIPIAILKNAVRIATLSSLGSYVSIDYINGTLHHGGGPVFSLLSLSLLLGVLWSLRRRERRSAMTFGAIARLANQK